MTASSVQLPKMSLLRGVTRNRFRGSASSGSGCRCRRPGSHRPRDAHLPTRLPDPILRARHKPTPDTDRGGRALLHTHPDLDDHYKSQVHEEEERAHDDDTTRAAAAMHHAKTDSEVTSS